MAKRKSGSGNNGSGRSHHGGSRGHEIKPLAEVIWRAALCGKKTLPQGCTVSNRELKPTQRALLRERSGDVIEELNKLCSKHGYRAQMSNSDIKFVAVAAAGK